MRASSIAQATAVGTFFYRRQLCSRSPIVPYSLSKNCWQIEPIGSPLVTVLFTKGMIAADFLGDPTGTRIGPAIPNGSCECRTDSSKLWAFSCCNRGFGAGRGFSCRPAGYRIGHALPNHRVLVEVIQKNATDAGGIRDPFDRIDGPA